MLDNFLLSYSVMNKRKLCGGTKYETGGPEEDTIVLPVSLTGLPEKIEVEGHKLFLKNSFHVSLVCIGKIIEKQHISIPDFINKVFTDFCEFTKDKNISFIQYQNKFRLVSQGERYSVVVMCEISNLDEFFIYLNEKYNIQIESQPTHVTLYTLEHNTGIFLTDSEDIKNLTKSISNPIGLLL